MIALALPLVGLAVLAIEAAVTVGYMAVADWLDARAKQAGR